MDIVAPMIRTPPLLRDGDADADMLRAYLATADSPSAGRDLHCRLVPARRAFSRSRMS